MNGLFEYDIRSTYYLLLYIIYVLLYRRVHNT